MTNFVTQPQSSTSEEKNLNSGFGHLFTALSKAQAEMEVATYDKMNPHFKNKYASMESIIAATRPALTKYGLSVIQKMICHSNSMVLSTILAHSSGEFIESTMPITPNGSEIQKLGSYLTYCKRYSYVAIVGCATGDEDDDGEEDRRAVTECQSKQMQAKKEEVKRPLPKEPITQPQINFLMKILEERGITYGVVQETWNLPPFNEILQTQLEELVKNIKTNWQPKATK